MERLIVIIGPTAVGKTNASIDLAQKLSTEIISGDSMLVYKGMDIGTAKPSYAERDGISHHLIDFLEPTQEFSVADFQKLAAEHITAINNKGKIPILAGGTGLYVKALLEGYQFNQTAGDDEFRRRLERLAKEQGNLYVHSMLAKVDYKSAERLHPNNLRRVIRALEVFHMGNENISQEKAENALVYDAVVIGLNMERQLLYQRINQRVDTMIEMGLQEEVARLLADGISPECQSMQGIGYKEMVAYFRREVDLTAAAENIKQATRHFAKRQLTWYRKMPYITWYDVNNFESYEEMVASFYSQVAGKFLLEVE
ncbi:MAG: tRNA (adenosine(37)-N6)-dimethylallyltransferase MiaA [Pelosinus sp.]|nr:tRNA (adenosine(37)-N6)-dimethylallyltransferase MiaA [Pelosinus sp.]